MVFRGGEPPPPLPQHTTQDWGRVPGWAGVRSEKSVEISSKIDFREKMYFGWGWGVMHIGGDLVVFLRSKPQFPNAVRGDLGGGVWRARSTQGLPSGIVREGHAFGVRAELSPRVALPFRVARHYTL